MSVGSGEFAQRAAPITAARPGLLAEAELGERIAAEVSRAARVGF